MSEQYELELNGTTEIEQKIRQITKDLRGFFKSYIIADRLTDDERTYLDNYEIYKIEIVRQVDWSRYTMSGRSENSGYEVRLYDVFGRLIKKNNAHIIVTSSTWCSDMRTYPDIRGMYVLNEPRKMTKCQSENVD